MSLTCTRCQSSGFLNIEQVGAAADGMEHEDVLKWIYDNEGHDVQVCDCCGDGEGWHGVPGEHYNPLDPQGRSGPYEYNGGLCECH